MLLTVIICLICVEIQDLFLVKKSAGFFRSYWNQWNLRVMVLASLLLQLFLICFGHRRRRYTGNHPLCLSMFAWSTYMLADLMVTAVLSTLLRRNLDLKPQGGLVAFWTAFLLWHLGGSYNITAYSLEDNELWLRHLFAMVFQVAQAIYIFIVYGNNMKDRTLKFIACPIFIAGFLKYGERICALRRASNRELVKSVYPAPKKTQNSNGKKMIRTGLDDYNNKYGKYIEATSENNGAEGILCKANLAFKVFKPLFLDLPFELSTKFLKAKVYLDKSEEKAFKMVEIELEFLYDLLFTKLPIQLCKKHGVSLALRIFCFCSAVSSLIAFSLIPKPTIPMVDIVITYLLLGQVILLDLCTYYLQSRSNWLVRKFPGYKFYSLLVSPRSRGIQPEQGMKVMAQHSLIHHYVKRARRGWFSQIIKVFDTNDHIQKLRYTSWRPVDLDLKKFIFSRLQRIGEKYTAKKFEFKFLSELLENKGEALLRDTAEDDSRNIETDFTSRIFVWHIATELVYYDDLDRFRSQVSSCKIGKSLSDYMMYLVLVRPSMLPKGLDELINERTYTQASSFFPHEMKAKLDLEDARKQFTNAFFSSAPREGSSFISSMPSSGVEGLLLRGSRFAEQLKDLARKHRWDDEEKWELISEVWMEMMIYAAAHCSWTEHAQQLRHGGELLTHVALLMAHFGLSTQIQVVEDHGLLSEDLPPFAV